MTWIISPSRCTRPWQAIMPAEHQSALLLEPIRREDQVRYAGLVLDGDEHHPLGRARLLPDQHDPRHHDLATVPSGGQVTAGHHAPLPQDRPQEGDRVLPESQPDRVVVLDHLTALQHRRECNGWLDHLGLRRSMPISCGEQRQHGVRKSSHGPHSRAPTEAHRVIGVCLGQAFERDGRDASTTPDLLDAAVSWLASMGDELRAVGVIEALHHPEAKPYCPARRRGGIQACNPIGLC